MFNKDFFPTPLEVIEIMTEGETMEGKTILEPSGGKGDIVDYLLNAGAKDVIACESNEDLKKILQTKCRVIESDFLNLTSDRISHIDYIIMNPPFSADDKHILHAFDIAPAGCKIISLCNLSTLENLYTNSRKELKNVIDNFGSYTDLGDCFTEAERKTGVKIGLIKIQKAGTSYKTEFEGFFMDEEPEERQENSIISYNVVRDLVNRYVQAVKVFSEVLTVNTRLHSVTGSFFGDGLGIQVSLSYEDYKKALQKSGWMFILNKMNLTKYTTRGVREDINKFVEQQTNIPFTMRNIYHMLDMVVQTAGQRMDKAILEVFDRVTEHHHDNRHNIKGWKTNSHFLVGKKFILPNMISPAKEYSYTSETYSSLKSSFDGTIPDFEKALCYVTGEQFEEKGEWDYTTSKHKTTGILTVNTSINRNKYGEWYNSHFFKYKGYKNGNMHFEFADEKIWHQFNQRVAKLKGYPLYEGKEQTAYQNRQTGRKTEPKAKSTAPAQQPTILTTIKLKTA
jgi:predicted RNA methylase